MTCPHCEYWANRDEKPPYHNPQIFGCKPVPSEYRERTFTTS